MRSPFRPPRKSPAWMIKAALASLRTKARARAKEKKPVGAGKMVQAVALEQIAFSCMLPLALGGAGSAAQTRI